MHRKGKYSQNSSIWLVWLDGWVFVYKWSGCGLESETCTRHDNNIQSNAPHR